MVNFSRNALVAILAATASAEHHRIGRRHIHARDYSVAPPPAEYSTASVPASSSAVNTVPEASGSSSAVQTVPEASGSKATPYPTGGHGHSHSHTHPAPSGASGVPSAPYSYGNGTTYGPTGTGTGAISTPDVTLSTATVVPVPETSEVGSSVGVSTNGVPTGGLPGTTPADEATCGPATVTVTVTGNTVTVTAGKSSSAAVPPVSIPEGQSSAMVPSASVPAGQSSAIVPPASIPMGQSSAVVPSVGASSAGNSYPAATPSAGTASAPVETIPVASDSSKPAGSASYPAATASNETPATTPVASEQESQSVYSQKTSEVSQPKPTSEVATSPVASASSSQKVESSSTSSAAQSSGTSTYSVSGNKRGIIYQETSDLATIKEQGSKCGWAWNWNNNNFGMEGDWNYVPILNNLEQAGDFNSAASKAVAAAPSNSRYVMGLNEPDMKAIYGGSEMSASDAASNYIKYVNPLKDVALLGSISITSTAGDENAGIPYLQQWKKECDKQGGCTVDFVCLHWYGNPDQDGETQGEGFITYMKSAIDTVHELWGNDMKIWVTEFAAKPDLNVDAGNHDAFIKKTLPYLDGESNIDRYAYFMAAPGFMIKADGTFTDAGATYFGN